MCVCVCVCVCVCTIENIVLVLCQGGSYDLPLTHFQTNIAQIQQTLKKVEQRVHGIGLRAAMCQRKRNIRKFLVST